MAVTAIIRLMHPKHFCPVKRGYRRTAFQNSSGGGVSCIECDCIQARGVHECEHIKQLYSERISGDPPVLWQIQAGELAAGSRLEPDSSNGDDCHRNLYDMTDTQCRNLLKSKQNSDFEICEPDGKRPATTERLLELRASFDAANTPSTGG